MAVGIEAMNLYGGVTFVDVRTLFQERGLDLERFDNLMMEKKSMGLPCEDAVTNAVNAAQPIVARLNDAERDRIEMVITCTESGLDFGKSLSTYVHDYLGLNRHCRLFEAKQACYAGSAALQMAINTVASGVSPGGKVLVIATDVARAAVKMTYAEPSQGTGAIAMLVGDRPEVFEVDFGANGLYGYEVMDTCRPQPDIETGDADLSLLSYLDCLENAYLDYADKVEGADFQETFDYLAFHTPFAGMVKGAHRKMMRKLYRLKKEQSEDDFQKRMSPSLAYCVQVGNVYSATVFFALCGLIDHADLNEARRVGLFSYGSGCSSEFFSGLITARSKEKLAEMGISQRLGERYRLNMAEYDNLLDLNAQWPFGVKNRDVDLAGYAKIYEQQMEGRALLRIKRVDDYHREYVWS